MTDFRALCEELVDLLDCFGSTFNIPIETSVVGRARVALAEQPVGPTDEESDAFAIVQMRLDDLAGDQELMIYRWPKAGDWDIQHTNPFSSVQLGEINGKYSCAGTTLEEAVRKLANALPAPSLKEQALAEQPVVPTDEELWEAWGCFEHEPFSKGDTIMQLREFLARWGQP
jgi:hypothetical protein